jgi:hypothetical protein
VAVILVACAALSTADVPRTVSFQGVLKDSDGNVVPDGTYDVTFTLYQVGSGDPSWIEEQIVTTMDGRFDVLLGSGTPIHLDFSGHYELGIAVNYEPELTPRIQLASVPYAFRAEIAEEVVGGGERTGYVTVSPAAFISRYPDNPLEYYVNVGYWVTGRWLVAPVNLPHGATITKMTSYWSMSSLEDWVHIQLYRGVLSTGWFDAMAYTYTNNYSGEPSSSYDDTIDYALVDNEAYSYFIDVTADYIDGLTYELYGVTLEYTYSPLDVR